jgi:hypothetical protein
MELFPFAPDWANPVTERLEWLTDVIEGHDATEERTPLRTLPRRTLEYRLLVTDHEAAALDALLWRWQADQYILPIWTDPQTLGTTLSAGATSIPAQTDGYDFSAPGLAVLWSDAAHYEVVNVQSLAADAITLSAPTVSDWPATARLYPTRVARLTDKVEVPYHTSAIAEATVRFELDPVAITPATGSTLYRGVEVFETVHNWVEARASEYQRKTQRFDYAIGTISVDDLSGLPSTLRSHRTLLNGRDGVTAWRRWLAARQGRYAPVWVPSRTLDLEQAQPITSGSTILKVKALSYAVRYQLQTGRRDIALKHLPSGTWYYRRINAVTSGSPGEENITLDAALGVAAAVGDLNPISWLTLSRLEADAVEIAWHTPTLAESTIQLRGVRE